MKALVAAYILFFLASTVFVLARTVWRLRLRTWKLDDTLLTVAWLFTLLASVVCSLCAFAMANVQMNTFSVSNLAEMAKVDYFLSAVYPVILLLTKLSICFTYLRVFSSRPQDRDAILWYIFFLGSSTFIADILTLFPCWPMTTFWRFVYNPTLKCMDYRIHVFVTAGANILGSVWITGFIAMRLLRLPSTRRRIMVLILILAAGSLLILAAVEHAIYLTGVQASDVNGSLEVRYSYQVWTAFELNFSLVCAAAALALPRLKDQTSPPSSSPQVEETYPSRPSTSLDADAESIYSDQDSEKPSRHYTRNSTTSTIHNDESHITSTSKKPSRNNSSRSNTSSRSRSRSQNSSSPPNPLHSHPLPPRSKLTAWLAAIVTEQGGYTDTQIHSTASAAREDAASRSSSSQRDNQRLTWGSTFAGGFGGFAGFNIMKTVSVLITRRPATVIVNDA